MEIDNEFQQEVGELIYFLVVEWIIYNGLHFLELCKTFRNLKLVRKLQQTVLMLMMMIRSIEQLRIIVDCFKLSITRKWESDSCALPSKKDW